MVDKVKGTIIGEDKQRILQVIQEVMVGYSRIRIGNDGCIELNIEVSFFFFNFMLFITLYILTVKLVF